MLIVIVALKIQQKEVHGNGICVPDHHLTETGNYAASASFQHRSEASSTTPHIGASFCTKLTNPIIQLKSLSHNFIRLLSMSKGKMSQIIKGQKKKFRIGHWRNGCSHIKFEQVKKTTQRLTDPISNYQNKFIILMRFKMLIWLKWPKWNSSYQAWNLEKYR